MDNNIPTFEEFEKKHGKLINVEDFRKHLNMSRELVMDLIEKGVFGPNVVKVGTDVQPKKGAPTAKYYFLEEWAKQLKREEIGYTLKEIAKKLHVPYAWLRNLSTKGYLNEGRISRYFWNMEWFEENLTRLHETSYRKKGKHRQSMYYDLLNDEQQKWIEDYLNRRKSGQGIRIGHKLQWAYVPAKVERTIKSWRKTLSIVFYKIICGRCGIKNYYVLERSGKYRDLNEEEMERFNPDVFKVVDFSPSDIDWIRMGYKDTTFTKLFEKHLKPFLYFVLNKLKEEWIEKKQRSLGKKLSKEEKEELERAKEFYETFEMGIELAISKVPIRTSSYSEEQLPPIFLTHEQVLMAKDVIRNDPSLNDPLKKTVLFMIGCLIGIRPDELAHLRIDNFVLDPETKLLKRFKFDDQIGDLVEIKKSDPHYEKGWGRLFITYNKGGYSPSHPKFGTLVVPRLVTLINLYLKTVLYVENPNAKGEGYLLRPKAELPFEPYTSRGMVQWLSPYAEQKFLFLPEEERKHFKYYDVRHTVYNLLIKANIEGIDFVTKERAAQIHARHDIKKKAGNTGRRSYTKDISMLEYYTVIDSVLNFPWDLGDHQDGAFYTWAEEKGFIKRSRKRDMKEEVTKTEEDISASLPKDIQQELEHLEKELAEKERLADQLAKGPRGEYKDIDKWTEKTVQLDKEIKQIKQQIQSLKRKGGYS
ncbi:hypothetical protein DER53_03525 [Parageobacillus toebii NBRC 107807]|uniref:Integrase n=1 Tax=Parageobacillus toebii NBRC 107807 TaxID=1223503 RepID=A0A6G9J1I2_9BACL|nr:hypothetical protein [Parageobacillus toebii]MBB3868683.1 integrase [Parageobacillus toebii NBRC 107807]QIQ32039.1 hypothetical protein DER53_03525 [Parageobacillus toebii NBRC 107807]